MTRRTSAEIGASLRAFRRGTPEYAERMMLSDEVAALKAVRSACKRNAKRRKTLDMLRRLRAEIDRLEMHVAGRDA